MYIKITKSGPRRYVQLVEAFRDDQGKPRQRTVATLGRLETVATLGRLETVASEVDSLINGLLRVTGREPVGEAPEQTLQFEFSKAFGDLYALQQLWQQLGFDAFRRVFRSGKRTLDVELLLRILVFNRLSNPDSKLGVLRWLETVQFPGGEVSAVSHQHLLRAMDAMVKAKDAVEETLASTLRPLIDQELSVVFYDLTTVSVTGDTTMKEELRAFGRSKDGGVARQVVIGLIQTADGLPLAHEVFEGNVGEASTLLPMLDRLAKRFPIRRVVLVADRGLLNLDNLAALDAIKLPSGEALEYIIAVPGSRYGDFDETIRPLQESHAASVTASTADVDNFGNTWIDETCWQERRLVVAHDEEAAQAKTEARRQQVEQLMAQADQWCDKLAQQEDGHKGSGRPLSESGITARFYQTVKEAGLAHIIDIDLGNEGFAYHYRALRQQALERLDGKLLLVTNVVDCPAPEIVRRYKSLADIERGFRVLKSELEIGPMYHRLPKRIRAHAMICFIALILHRVMRMRLKAADNAYSPGRALSLLSRIQRHQVKINGTNVEGLSTVTTEQLELFRALQIPKPTAQ
ncbi:MAG: IS1634 family transposase [Hahellaceae bacterium]|nr:IS1634 family transposase [Hahellaceae bacterium]